MEFLILMMYLNQSCNSDDNYKQVIVKNVSKDPVKESVLLNLRKRKRS